MTGSCSCFLTFTMSFIRYSFMPWTNYSCLKLKKTVSYRLVSFKQLQMSSILSQIRNFSNFYLRSFSIGIKTISKIDFSKLITNTRKATLLYVQFGFTMISDLSALLSGTHTHTDTDTDTATPHTHTHLI